MKNKFTKEDIGKSFKLTVKNKNTKNISTIRGVFLGDYITANGVPYKQLSFYGNIYGNEQYQIIDLNSLEYTNIQPTRLPKDVGERGRYIANSIQKTIKAYKKLTKESEILLNKLEVIFDNDFNLFVKKFINKYKNLNKLEVINKFFEKYLPKLSIEIVREDYDSQEMEEYGIQNLDETLHLSLNVKDSDYCSFIAMEYFGLDNFKLNNRSINTINIVYPTFNSKHGMIISNFINLVARYKK